MPEGRWGRGHVCRALVVLLYLVLACGCEREEEECAARKLSEAESLESHFPGRNCMNCHRPSGGGAGCFVIAGSLYDSSGTSGISGALMRMRTLEAGGDLRASLVSDGYGNFYTTYGVDFSGGLYPSVTGPDGATSFMPYHVTIGSCNSCHGVTAGKIRIE
jgi:hypothetical protein